MTKHILSRVKGPVATVAILLLAAVTASAQPRRDLAKTPPMGWNSWNFFGKANINEQIVHEVIDAMADQGLRDAGYVYVVVDGGWRDTKLGPNGELLPHPTKFPHGIKPLADYAHSKGLKFGVHTVPGTHDCGGDAVGGYGHEAVHVKQFVDWGLDFIKLDKCRYKPGWTEDNLKATYIKWRDLLAHCGRDIVFSISAYTFRDWYPEVGQMARTTGDIKAHIHKTGAVFDDMKLSVMDVAEENNRSAAFAGNGYWNDAEMMVTGKQGLSQEEQKAHFALWCVMSAPLMLGNDPRNMTQDEKDIVLNRECIAVDQDPIEQGRRIKQEGGSEIWAKKLTGGRVAVILLNRNAKTARPITLTAKDVGLSGKLHVRDLYAKKDLETMENSMSKETAPHACWFLMLSSAAAK